MFAIIGILIVIGAVVGGYLLEHGNLLVLLQPAELLIIVGAAIGTLIIANPLPTVMRMFKGIIRALSGSSYSPAFYLETLTMLGDIFQVARKQGLVKLEMDVEEPEKSGIFTKYPKFLKNHHARDFVCDTLRVAIIGGVEPTRSIR